MTTLRQRFDPRQHLAASIAWATFAIAVLAALIAGTLAANVAERHARADTEKLLTRLAIQVHLQLAMSLETRRFIMLATAAQIAAATDRSPAALRRHLETVQAQFPEFAWMAVANTQGGVMASTSDVPRDAKFAAHPWFLKGQQTTFVGEVRAPPPSDQQLSRLRNGEPPWLLELAAPIALPGKAPSGVLGAQISWDWVQRLQGDLLLALDTRRRLELLLATKDGTILIGPSGWLGRKLASDADITEGGERLVGRYAMSSQGNDGLGWTVVVRQDADAALGPAYTTRRVVFITVLLAGVLSALAATLVTQILMRRLTVLANGARALGLGTQNALKVPEGADEVSRIGAVLAATIEHLQQEKQALSTLNAELDARVAERTARIERLSDEARHAAVTRERLRLARELHDTLAHSLMALLTQIRLIRKMRERFAPEEFEAELDRAEGVAASGLADARAAIAQMRHNDVRDAGLGSALREILTRFAERSGVAIAFEFAPRASDLADERAETVFRIVEEALNNVERHAQARNVRVSMTETGFGEPQRQGAPRVRVEIVDDGVGFDPKSARIGHYGLIGIQEQADLIGARLGIRSAPGVGTCLELDFAIDS